MSLRDLDPVAARAVRKAAWRLLPFLFLLYIAAFLDRANIGFAKASFLADTGLSNGAYAFGAGIFFAGYAFLEVPSNLIMHRVGARLWMCRIMVTWGLISAAMMFAWNEAIFYTLRFLLGVAEAGFFPGVILYLTYWFPASLRGRMIGYFYFGAPLALIVGGPVSGLLLKLDETWGLTGWQWMFLVEGLLASVLGLWTYWWLVNRPADAAWLSAEEKRSLQRVLDLEETNKLHHGPHRILSALTHPRVLYFCLLYMIIQVSVYGVTFYLPSQVSRLLQRDAGLVFGLVTAIPWSCALLAVWLAPRFAEITGRRRATAGTCLVVAAIGISMSVSGQPTTALAGLSLAAAGFIAAQPVFWTFPTGELGGAPAAGAIALINSFGALGGFIAPNVKNLAEEALRSESAGLYLLAVATLCGALLAFLIPRKYHERVGGK